MAVNVTWDDLRNLAAFRAERGCAISVFLNLDPSETVSAGQLQTRVNSVLDEAAKTNGANPDRLSHDQREALKSDFGRIRQFFEQELDREGARGAAVFCAGLDGAWNPLTLPDRLADGVRVGRQFYLAPLVPLVHSDGGVFVAHVSREQGQIYRLRSGRLDEIVDRSEEQPGQHDQGGWSQARYERHIDKLVEEHLREVAEEIDRLVRSTGPPKLILVSTEDMRTEFEGLLSHESQRALVGWTNVEAHAGPAEVLEAVKPVLESSIERDEREALERWREEAGRNGRASSGWQETLEAASDARVDVLLYQDGVRRAAWRCPACGRVSAQPGNCPLDDTPMEEDEAGLDLAVQQTLAHGGSALAIRHHQDLEPVDGIGALLRF